MNSFATIAVLLFLLPDAAHAYSGEAGQHSYWSYIILGTILGGIGWVRQYWQHLTKLDNDVNYELAYYSSKGDAPQVRRVLKAGANVDAVNEVGETALILASRHNRTDVTSTLLKAGADLTIRPKKGGMTAAEIAQKKNFNNIVAMLTESAQKDAAHGLNKEGEVRNQSTDLSIAK